MMTSSGSRRRGSEGQTTPEMMMTSGSRRRSERYMEPEMTLEDLRPTSSRRRSSLVQPDKYSVINIFEKLYFIGDAAAATPSTATATAPAAAPETQHRVEERVERLVEAEVEKMVDVEREVERRESGSVVAPSIPLVTTPIPDVVLSPPTNSAANPVPKSHSAVNPLRMSTGSVGSPPLTTSSSVSVSPVSVRDRAKLWEAGSPSRVRDREEDERVARTAGVGVESEESGSEEEETRETTETTETTTGTGTSGDVTTETDLSGRVDGGGVGEKRSPPTREELRAKLEHNGRMSPGTFRERCWLN
ncbi:hypothetical protein BC829DRAFT_227976 [Chytridium lagenaria]|nr:hypothetical protein BC829DRAFT_227976 [Chytridium lagenaria]